MEVFSLEDDAYEQMFITQESKDDKIGVQEKDENDSFLGMDVMDFSPSPSFVVRNDEAKPHYSDISEDEFMGQDEVERYAV